MPDVGKAQCCHIKKNGVRCSEDADFCIYDGPEPHRMTKACTKHVGGLLTDVDFHYVYTVKVGG